MILTNADLSVDQITAAYKNCVDVGSHPNWNSQVHSADNLAILREADMHLYDLISECYANDDQVTAQLHVLEDSAPNPGIASFEYLDRQFGSTEIEDTMPMLLKIVEKELMAGATVADRSASTPAPPGTGKGKSKATFAKTSFNPAR